MIKIKDYYDYKLCFVDCLDDWNTYKLYFTDNIEKVYGDDWNDRPADANAGRLYKCEDFDIYEIIVEFSGYGSITFGGKTYSVDDMNAHVAVWLIYENIYFEGGETLKSVISKILNHNAQTHQNNVIDFYVKFNGDD